MLLQRISTQSSRTLLNIGSYVSEIGIVHILIRAQRLGEGWQGRAVFTSAITKQRLELTSPVEQRDAECVCCYELPSLLDEWDVEFSLVFDSKHSVSKYVYTPADVLLGGLHIDTLDAIIPSSASVASLDICGVSAATPCLCEIWLCHTSLIASDGSALAAKLLYMLLFEAVMAQTRARITAIMLDSHTVQFCVAGSAGPTGAVTAMCVFERDHLALRIQSATDWLAFAAVCYSLAKRLSLLLGDVLSENSTSNTGRSLSALQEKYAGIIVAANQDKTSYDGASQWARPHAIDFVDFAMVQGDWPLSLFE
ncbi:hypothetical protein GGH94_003011 [Coemansia aciculifera]|uniref:Uncharacterized protein n=1 Tax=Coemansia aciculifera TaxID=417176 RepID=A0A9W8IR86_9FUNG|nr:hypothetical protein GGH94_003011 [Coemansia aciculifera]KAJ2876900.1 hypothetical protein GGH93_000391 [Coemansia aciculifera]